MSLWSDIASAISEASGIAFKPARQSSLSGGCINRAFRLSDRNGDWFVKTNRADRLAMFEAEADGLDALASTQTFAVPRPLCTGQSGESSFIVMQHMQLGHGSSVGWRRAGQQLAEMHRARVDSADGAASFGWHRDNTIGATPQHNERHVDWAVFWRDQRLGFQLEEAARNGHGGRLQQLGEQLLSRFAVLLDHDPQPSMLHGDLWGGNMSFTAGGDPALYDPAVYQGDREAELAMTELFGGFSADFYAAYRDAWPLDSGYTVRKTLYNLYHVLNHLNLFGGSYRGQAERMMESLLAEC